MGTIFIILPTYKCRRVPTQCSTSRQWNRRVTSLGLRMGSFNAKWSDISRWTCHSSYLVIRIRCGLVHLWVDALMASLIGISSSRDPGVCYVDFSTKEAFCELNYLLVPWRLIKRLVILQLRLYPSCLVIFMRLRRQKATRIGFIHGSPLIQSGSMDVCWRWKKLNRF